MSGFWNIFVGILRKAGWLTIDAIRQYFRFLLAVSGIAGGMFVFLLAIAVLVGLAGWNNDPWYGLLLILVAIAVPVIEIVAFPLVWASKWLWEQFSWAERAAKGIAGAAFWAALMPIVGFQSGFYGRPKALLWLAAISSLLSVGGYVGAIWTPRRLSKIALSAQLIVMLLLAALAIPLPRTSTALSHWWEQKDVEFGGGIATPIIELTVSEPANMPPFVDGAGQPLLFGYKDASGRWHIANQTGFLDSGAKLHPLEAQEERDAVTSQVKADHQLRLNADQAEHDRQADLRRAADEVARKTAESERVEARARLAEADRLATIKFRELHVRGRVPKLPGDSCTLAIFVVNAEGQPDGDLQKALANASKRVHCSAADDVLRPVSVSDGTFERLYDGDAATFQRLDLASTADFVSLGRVTVVVRGPLDKGVYNAKLELTIATMRTADGTLVDRQTVTTTGLAMSRDAAIAEANRQAKTDVAGLQLTLNP